MTLRLELYVDVLFGINTIMNFVLLSLVRLIRKQQISIYRVLAGAALGAFISCLAAIFMRGPMILTFVIKYLFTSVLVTAVTFGWKIRRTFLLNYLNFLLGTFLLGGIVQAILQLISSNQYLTTFYKNAMDNKLTIFLLIGMSIILTPIIRYIYYYGKENRNTEENLYDVKLYVTENPICCKGFMDSGNCLLDPVSKNPVVIVDKRILQDEFDKILAIRPTALRIITYASVGKEHGLLYGLQLEKIVISNSQDEICTKDVVAALSENGFANRNEYQVLLHHDLLRF